MIFLQLGSMVKAERTLAEVARMSLADAFLVYNDSPAMREASIQALKKLVKDPSKTPEIKVFQLDVSVK